MLSTIAVTPPALSAWVARLAGICVCAGPVLAAATAEPAPPLPQQLPVTCEAAAVGGGWAGVYSAYRLAALGVQVCLFEATERIGGRTYSHRFQVGRRHESFTLDLGAYRFSPDMHLPGDIILRNLRLPVSCYEPDCPDASLDFPPPFHFNYSAPLVRIVDGDGMPAGYVTAIDGMVNEIRKAGGSVFLGARLTDVEPVVGARSVRLRFGDHVVEVQRVVLNLPRQAILGLPTLRAATPQRTVKMQECVKFDIPDTFFPPGQKLDLGHSLTKAYAFYEEAWWHTRLNKTSGQWPSNAFVPVNTSEGIPIGIHFNDGPVRCEAPGVGCRGFLEVFYAPASETFFEGLRPGPLEPLGLLREGGDGTAKLRRLHAAIMEATAELWERASVAKPAAPPTLLAVGVWSREGRGYTAPTKVYYSTAASVPGGPDPLERACGVPGLSEAEYRLAVMAPLAGHDLIVANNDWVAQTTETLFGDWAEESLLQAERGLRSLGFSAPGWLDAAYYRAKVADVLASDLGVRAGGEGPLTPVLV